MLFDDFNYIELKIFVNINLSITNMPRKVLNRYFLLDIIVLF